MSDQNLAPVEAPIPGESYAYWEVAYWLIGIVMIPLVPILMITFFTPFSGVGPSH